MCQRLANYEEKRKVWTINRLRGSHHMANTASNLNTASSLPHNNTASSPNTASSLPRNSSTGNRSRRSSRSSHICRGIRIG